MYIHLVFKTLFATVAFALVLACALIVTTLVFQGHTHPDDWTTTRYDIAAVVVVAAAYAVVMARILRGFWKARARRAPRA